MPSSFRLSLFVLMLAAVVARADEASVRGVVQAVDEAKGTFTLKRTSGKELVAKVDKYTELQVDGKAAKLTALKAGQEATVLLEESTAVAVRVVSRTPKSPVEARRPEPEKSKLEPNSKPGETFVSSLRLDEPAIKADFDKMSKSLQDALRQLDLALSKEPTELSKDDHETFDHLKRYIKESAVKAMLKRLAAAGRNPTAPGGAKPIGRPEKFVTSLKLDDPKLKADFDLLTTELQESLNRIDLVMFEGGTDLKPRDVEVLLVGSRFFKPGAVRALLVKIADECGVQELISTIGNPADQHDKVKCVFAVLPGTEKLVAIQIAKRIKANGVAGLNDQEKLFVGKHRLLFNLE